MAKAKQYQLTVGFLHFTGSLTKMQALQRAIAGTTIVNLQGIDDSVSGESKYVYVEDEGAMRDGCEVKPMRRPFMTAEQYRRETMPKITQQPLGSETI